MLLVSGNSGRGRGIVWQLQMFHSILHMVSYSISSTVIGVLLDVVCCWMWCVVGCGALLDVVRCWMWCVVGCGVLF